MLLSSGWQRGLTVAALVALGADAVLLATAGLMAHRPELLARAGAALLLAVGVWAAWRRQRRKLAAIARERAALVATLRDLGRDLPEH